MRAVLSLLHILHIFLHISKLLFNLPGRTINGDDYIYNKPVNQVNQKYLCRKSDEVHNAKIIILYHIAFRGSFL